MAIKELTALSNGAGKGSISFPRKRMNSPALCDPRLGNDVKKAKTVEVFVNLLLS